MFKYTLLNKLDFELEENIIENIFLEIEKIVDKKQNGLLNIIFLGEDEIKKYNKDYRKIDKITDVLSFHYFDTFEDLQEGDIAGEILMCEEKLISQGKEFGLGTEKEFYKLLIHSILHILGYDHELDEDYQSMKAIEDKIWKII